jgi:hypothetical protein
MTANLVVLCIAGFLLHFLGRYGEFLKTQATRIGPHTYIAQDLPGWLSAAIGTAVTLVLLPEVGPLIGIDPGKVGAVLAGYFGSSLPSKLPAMLTGKGVR